MANTNKTQDIIEFIILFLTALSEMLLILFYSVFENKMIVNVALVAIPVVFCAIFYYRYRKSHYRQIYSKDELKQQHRN